MIPASKQEQHCPGTLFNHHPANKMTAPTRQKYTPQTAQEAFELACASHNEGHLSEAQERFALLIEQYPNSALLRYNLGLVYFEQTQYNRALNAFTLADQLQPEDTDTLFNLALCQKKSGDFAAAIATYGRILVLDPEQVDCLYNLGGCYRDQYEDEQAIACYQHVLALQPDYLPAINNLGYVHHRAGKKELAVQYYQRIVERQPHNESIRYLLAALLGTPTDHAPDSYVRDFFNDYAGVFEHNLVVELGYDNPNQLFDCLCRSALGGIQCRHGVDLGCGTGLSGFVFQKMLNELDGVDLSEQMLLQAADKGCYAHIHHDSILHHLATTEDTYDFFLATDVFIYVGDLSSIFSLAGDRARPEALFCFSTERLEEEGFHLLPTGRFAYSPDYIKQTAMAAGWAVLTRESAPLRRERDEWLTGDLWILRRQETAA